MPELEMGPLSDRLSDDEIAELRKKMDKLGAPPIPAGDESHAGVIGDAIDQRALTKFLDHLDGHDAAAEIYVPVEFDGVVEVAGFRVGSLPVLIEVLEEVREELDLESDEEYEDDEAEEEEDDDDDDRSDLREVWEHFQQGAESALEKRLPLHVKQ